ncbi:MAG: hypothetical protein ACOVMI_03995, partial [Chitinophagaceae bacterium]
MKQFLLLIFVLPTLFVKAQKYIPTKAYAATWQFAGVKGRVKKIIETQNIFIVDSLLNKEVIDSFKNHSITKIVKTAIFNEFGYKTEEFFQHLAQENNSNNFFDSLNVKSSFIPKIKTNISNNDKSNTCNIKFFYDNFNQLIKVKVSNNNNETLHAANFEYNEKKDLIKTKFFGYKNSLTDEYNNYYDKKDSLIMFDHYNYNSKEFATLKIKYINPNKSYRGLYLIDNKLYREEFFEKDSEGNKSELTTWTNRSGYHKRKIFYTQNKYNNFTLYQVVDDKGVTIYDEQLSYEYFENNGLIKKMYRTNLINNR